MKARVFALMLGLCSSAFAQWNGLPDAVRGALTSARVGEASVAVVVQDAVSGKALLDINADVPMNPASVMKLVTTYAGLNLLGPAYTWRTSLLTSGTLDGRGVLHGDVFFQGSGDPKLTQERLWLMLRELRARGVRQIEGDVVLDRGLFDVGAFSPGQFDNQPLRAYNVVPDALLLHFKALELRFVPEGERVRVLAEPGLAGVTVESKLKAGSGSCDNWRQQLRYAIEDAGGASRLKFEGAYPAQCGEKTWSLGVLEHSQFGEQLFRALWANVGGKLSGRVREGTTPVGARVLASTESPALAEIVRDINKWSNNVMARQLLLSIGSARGARPARPGDGATAIAEWLSRSGIGMPELVLENGSGLSRAERISARSLARLLGAALGSPVMPEYLSSLPIGGVDGTMQKRLGQDETAGRVRIKTGTLDGVRAMAGYVLDRNARQRVVVMMVNDPNANAGAVREAEDALLRWVHAATP